MEQEKIYKNFSALPPEAQRQVMDFIEFLKLRYEKTEKMKSLARTSISDDSFIGIWADRESMKNSSQWVRDLRESEWES